MCNFVYYIIKFCPTNTVVIPILNKCSCLYQEDGWIMQSGRIRRKGSVLEEENLFIKFFLALPKSLLVLLLSCKLIFVMLYHGPSKIWMCIPQCIPVCASVCLANHSIIANVQKWISHCIFKKKWFGWGGGRFYDKKVLKKSNTPEYAKVLVGNNITNITNMGKPWFCHSPIIQALL